MLEIVLLQTALILFAALATAGDTNLMYTLRSRKNTNTTKVVHTFGDGITAGK